MSQSTTKKSGQQRIQPVVLTVVKKNSKILLTKRAESDPEDAGFNNIWQIPGGGLEFGEKPEETAMREAREELGIDIEIVKLIPAIYTSVRGNWQGILIPYSCKMKYEEQEVVINHEASDYRWVTLDEALKLDLTPFTEMIIELAFEE